MLSSHCPGINRQIFLSDQGVKPSSTCAIKSLFVLIPSMTTEVFCFLGNGLFIGCPNDTVFVYKQYWVRRYDKCDYLVFVLRVGWIHSFGVLDNSSGNPMCFRLFVTFFITETRVISCQYLARLEEIKSKHSRPLLPLPCYCPHSAWRRSCLAFWSRGVWHWTWRLIRATGMKQLMDKCRGR